MNTRSRCSLLLVACGLAGCQSSFDFTPPEGHPARADSAFMPPPIAHAPDDYVPPEPVETGSDSGMSGDMDGSHSMHRHSQEGREGGME